MHRRRDPRGHVAGANLVGGSRVGAALAATGQDQMPRLANEDASVLQHHARVEERKVSVQMTNLALATRMRPIDHLHDVFSLNGVLFGIEGNGLPVLLAALERLWAHSNNFAVHVQHLSKE